MILNSVDRNSAITSFRIGGQGGILCVHYNIIDFEGIFLRRIALKIIQPKLTPY